MKVSTVLKKVDSTANTVQLGLILGGRGECGGRERMAGRD
jgi:hypothetical protein